MRLPPLSSSRRAAALASSLALAAAAAAQTTQVLPARLARVPAGSYTRYPFGLAVPIRLQTIYEARETGLTTARTLRMLEVRADQDRFQAAKRDIVLSVAMSTVSVRSGTQSFRFAANRGRDHRTVWTAKKVALPASLRAFPGGFVLPLPLDVPFRYDPKAGNLMIEYAVTAQPKGDWVFDTPSPFGLGAHRPVAAGCRGFLDPKGGGIGHTIAYNFWGGAANAPSAHLLGFRKLSVPVPIPGSSGCFLHIGIQLVTATALDKSGHGFLPLPLPNDPRLVSLSVFAQQLVFGSRLEISNAAETVIGGVHGIARVYSLGTTVSATGTPQDGAALVVRLTW